MIVICNFKYKSNDCVTCRIQLQQGGTSSSLVKCVGEDNCILYQIYKTQYQHIVHDKHRQEHDTADISYISEEVREKYKSNKI